MLKIAVISDTHDQHKKLTIPNSDILIHCGDFSNDDYHETTFLSWLAEQKAKYKILVAGNHDFRPSEIGFEAMRKRCKRSGIVYLEDTSVEIEGILFHGSPWVLDNAKGVFSEDESFLKQKWSLIPDDVKVLITHTPQFEVLDKATDWNVDNMGSKTLRERIVKLNNLSHHFFGHAHTSAGTDDTNNYISHNASSFNDKESIANEIKIFKIETL